MVMAVMMLAVPVGVQAAPKATRTYNLSLGVGETESLSDYIKEDSNVTWYNANNGFTKIENTDLIGVKVGTAKIRGTAEKVNYVLNVKVLKDDAFSTAEKDTKIYSPTTNQEIKKTQSKKDNKNVTYTDFRFTVGTKDTFSIAKILEKDYYLYTWVSTVPALATISSGKITTKKEGLVRISGSGTADSAKGNINRFYITIDDNYDAMTISTTKKRIEKWSKYLPEKYTDYVFKNEGKKNVTFNEDGTFVAPGDSGMAVVSAVSKTGGKNYTLFITVI